MTDAVLPGGAVLLRSRPFPHTPIMQTFLPYRSFTQSAAVLDDRRLGNQCYRECLTLYNGGWPHHPASKMWRNAPDWLCAYALACAVEISRRPFSFDAQVADRWMRFWSDQLAGEPTRPRPAWLGSTQLHKSHQSNLIRKDAAHYARYWPSVAPTMEYHWPVP